MANIGQWLKAQLGPSPVIGLSMLVMTVLAILSAFKINPSLPPRLGYGVLIALVALANIYCAASLIRLWPQVVSGPRPNSYRLRPASRIRAGANGGVTGIDALDELERM